MNNKGVVDGVFIGILALLAQIEVHTHKHHDYGKHKSAYRLNYPPAKIGYI